MLDREATIAKIGIVTPLLKPFFASQPGNCAKTADAAGSGHQLSECQPDPKYLYRIEGDLRIEAALDVGGLAKAMLLAREQEIADGVSLTPQRLDHDLGLVRRHHGVLGTLKKDDRLRQPIGVINRRPFAIARLHFRKRPDEPVEISRFEFVGIARQCCGVADAVIACSALEEIAKGERREGSVAASTAAADDNAPCVHQSPLHQEFGAVHAVVHIDDAPIELQPLAVFAPETRAAAVVDIKHRNAAAGPELRAEIERARR